MSEAGSTELDVFPAAGPVPERLVGLSVRALVLSIFFTLFTYLVINRLGFMELVPPVPAMIVLLLLVGSNLVVGALGRHVHMPRLLRPLGRGELFLVYAAVSIAPVMDRGVYVLHYLLYPIYYGNDVNQWQEFFQYYPAFMIPQDPRVATGFWEGSASGLVPWDAWLVPLAWWMGFNMLIMVAVMCLVALFRRQWAQSERLAYPMLYLPLEFTGGFEGSALSRMFFRDPVMWIGFSIAAIYNILRIANELTPAMPEIKTYAQLATALTDPPWRWIRPLNLHFALDVWGLSYLMSGEVLLSSFGVYFTMKAVKLIGLQAGYRKSRFPFYQEVSSGASIALTLSMIYVARGHFSRVLRAIIRGRGAYDRNEAMSYRNLTVVFIAATAGMIAMMAHAGHRVDLLIIYFATLYMFTLVASRIRAEAGPPVPWTHPYGYDTQVAIHLFGDKFIRGYGSPQPMVLYYGLFYIGRTVFAHSGAQYFTDSLKLVDYGNAKRSAAIKIMLICCLLAGALAFWTHLDLGYRYGQAFYFAGQGGEHRTWPINWSRGQYQFLDRALEDPKGPDLAYVSAYIAGFVVTTLITWGRLTITSFPLHPLGMVMGTLYNDGSPYWGPFLVAWLVQRLALRYGSLPAYRRLVPAFVGLFFGHTIFGNVILRIISRLHKGL